MRKRLLVLLMAAVMGVMVLSMAGAAWASAPPNAHNCYGATTSFYAADLGAFRNPAVVGFPYNHYGPLVRDIAHSSPGAVGAGQRELRDALANCGANR